MDGLFTEVQKYFDCVFFLQHNGKDANHLQVAASAAKVGIDYKLS